MSAKYQFSNQWFDAHKASWDALFTRLELKGKPDLTYLEVGVFEGASLLWMMENVLTAPTSRAFAVDKFDPPEGEIFSRNVLASGFATRVSVRQGWSKSALRALPPESFDIAYIDGGHHASDVITDLVLVWDLLKDGALLILDDYWIERDNRFPKDAYPRPAVDFFLFAFGGQLELVEKDYQVIVRKITTPLARDFIRLGPYYYFWLGHRLFDPRIDREVTLESAERELLDELCKNLELSYCVADHPLTKTPAFAALLERLGVHAIGRERSE